MHKGLFLLLAILCCIGALVSLIMFISAIRFFELGRVLFYLILIIACGDFAVLSFLRWKKPSSDS